MPLRIMKVEIEGFRGINRQVSIDLGGVSRLVFGENGAGKSSILQAIEWGLYGKLLYISSDEFGKEDAIVNDFNPDNIASVKIVLKDDEGRLIKTKRTRKKMSSTTRGKAPLTVTINGTSYTKEEAEERLARIVGMTPEEYYSSVHLHQEAVRDIVLAKATERSEMIDRMLGLFHLREFISGLSSRPIEIKIKEGEKEISLSQAEKTRYTTLLAKYKKDLGELENTISSRGTSIDLIDIGFLANSFRDIQQSLSRLADSLSVKIKLARVPPTIEEAKRHCDDLYRLVSTLENKRLEAFEELKDRQSHFDGLSKGYQRALEAGVEDLGTLTEKRKGLETRITEIREEQRNLLDTHSKLKTEESIIKRLLSDKQELDRKISDLQEQHGDTGSIKEGTSRLASDIKSKESLIEQQSTLSKILDLSIRYVGDTKPKACPVCDSPVNHSNLLSSLKEKTVQFEAARTIEKIRKVIEDKRQQKEQAEDILEEIERLQKESDNKESDLRLSWSNIQSLGYTPTRPLLDFVVQQIDSILKEQQNIEQNLSTLMTEKQEVVLLEESAADYLDLEKEIKTTLETDLTGKDLLKLLKDKIRSLKKEIKKISALNPDFASIRENIDNIRDAIDFIEKRTELERIEKMLLPGVESRLQNLAAKNLQLQQLVTAVYDIREAATAAQESLLKTALYDLENGIKSYYSELLGHPHYVSLQLVSEKERGKYIYRIRASDEKLAHSTYVQTRFSTAQMNIVAISLFLAMASKNPLGFLVFDDPSQSLDPAHKIALASTIGKLSTEFQVILATQDSELQQALKESMKQVEIIKLDSWTTDGTSIH